MLHFAAPSGAAVHVASGARVGLLQSTLSFNTATSFGPALTVDAGTAPQEPGAAWMEAVTINSNSVAGSDEAMATRRSLPLAVVGAAARVFRDSPSLVFDVESDSAFPPEPVAPFVQGGGLQEVGFLAGEPERIASLEQVCLRVPAELSNARGGARRTSAESPTCLSAAWRAASCLLHVP